MREGKWFPAGGGVMVGGGGLGEADGLDDVEVDSLGLVELVSGGLGCGDGGGGCCAGGVGGGGCAGGGAGAARHWSARHAAWTAPRSPR